MKCVMSVMRKCCRLLKHRSYNHSIRRTLLIFTIVLGFIMKNFSKAALISTVIRKSVSSPPTPSSAGVTATTRTTRTTRTTKAMMTTIPNRENSNGNDPTHTRKNVAIIGAGAAGLATARMLSKKGFRPHVFEKEKSNIGVGGVWSYEPRSKTKPVYRGLRTNLPREIMAFREKKWGGDGTTMSFVTHTDVKQYLGTYMIFIMSFLIRFQ